LKKKIAMLLCLAMALGTLSACSGSSSSTRVVNICGWGENIEPALIDQFEEETGITVNYQEAESNETMYALIKQGGSDYDVIVPSDYMVGQLIGEGLLAELDFDNIPNFDLVDDQYKNLSYDPENKYSVPYTWGTLGIIYNSALVDEDVTSWSILFDEKYAGQVGMIGNPRDAIAIALMYLGYSVNTTDEAEIREAYQLIADAKSNGVYQGFFMDQLFDKMEAGETAICAYYAGDFLSMRENNEDLRFVVPEEGSNFFVDAMCVLKDAQHKEEAEEWINFITGTESSLQNMAFIQYASPNAEALEQYPAYYEELYGEALDDELFEVMAAPAETLERCATYSALPTETLDLYSQLWLELGIG
jgi:spermidine/putrescine-binding protein